MTTLCGYLKHDIRSPFFEIYEPTPVSSNEEEKKDNDDTVTVPTTTSDIIDIISTFSPNSVPNSISEKWYKTLVIFLRITFAYLSFEALLEGILFQSIKNSRYIYMGYLSNLTTAFTLLFYQLPVMIFSLNPNMTSTSTKTSTEEVEDADVTVVEQPSFLTKLTWASYSVATVSQLIVNIVYWGLLYTPGTKLSYSDLTVHGIACICLLFDGSLISPIPVRLKHSAFVYLYSISYIIWIIIHTFLGIGTYKDENGEDNNAVLYDIVDFKNDPKGATIMTLSILLVLSPLLFLSVYIISIWNPKKCSMDGSRRKKITITIRTSSNTAEESLDMNV